MPCISCDGMFRSHATVAQSSSKWLAVATQASTCCSGFLFGFAFYSCDSEAKQHPNNIQADPEMRKPCVTQCILSVTGLC
jgi:hypothetical protein